jgi:cytochrome c oxidase cbb3-type subunit 2
MPAYPWLLHNRLSYADLPERLRILRSAGLPYSLTAEEFNRNVTRYGRVSAMQFDIHRAEASLLLQARQRDFDGNPALLSELDALIAYIQMTGVPASTPADSPAGSASGAAPGSVTNSAH